VSDCFECLVDRHALCPDADVADYQASDDPDYELVDMYCCCGHEWTVEQLTTAAEYAEYAEELRRRGWSQPTDPGQPSGGSG
jgi:hypothetical protein